MLICLHFKIYLPYRVVTAVSVIVERVVFGSFNVVHGRNGNRDANNVQTTGISRAEDQIL